MVFEIEKVLYTIPPSGYALNPNSLVNCEIGVSYSEHETYVLGEVFMRNFVTMFDYSAMTVSFAVNINSSSTITKAPVSKLLITVLTLTSIIVVALAAFTTWYCIKKKKNNQKQSQARKSVPLFDKEANEDNLDNTISNLS